MGFLKLITSLFDDGAPNYNNSWLKHATDEELEKEREKVRLRWCSGEDVYDALSRFDDEMSRRAWNGKEYGFPARTEHGWYLSEDDD